MIISDDDECCGFGGFKRERDEEGQISRPDDFKDSVEFLRAFSNLDFRETDCDYLFILRDISLGRVKFDSDVDDNSSGDCNTDPEYEGFLKQLRVEGDLVIHQTPAGDWPSEFVRYNEHEGRRAGSSEFEDSQTVKGDCPLRTEPPRTSDAIARKERLESRKIRNSMLYGKDKTTGGNKRCRGMIPAVKTEARAPFSFDRSGSFGERLNLEPSPPPQPDPKQNHENRFDYTDESYQRFLGGLKRRGNVMVFEPNDLDEFIYYKDEECSSDSDIMIVENTPFFAGGFNPFVSSRAQHPWLVDEGMDGDESTEQSHFRVNLMKCVEKPYDALEYRDLLEKMHVKKPIERHRENRSGVVRSCILPDKLGMSYLESHKDFAKKLESAQDNFKRLQFLRAFFFWLKNAGHDDQFRPWKDPLFLKMVL